MEIPVGRPVSKSGVSVFEKCPMHYYGIYNLGMTDPSGPAAENGKMVHSWRERVRTGQCTLDFALDNAENETVRWMTELAVADDPYADAKQRLFEQEIRINESGQIVDNLDSALVRGFLDEVSVYDSLVVVEDLKTGKYKSFPPFERDLYAGTLVKALYPECNEIHFVHHWIQHNERPKWTYKWQKRLGLTICTVESPDGEKYTVSSRNFNPMLDSVISVVDTIRKSEPIPNPGKHCQNWYGLPCQFRDTICPHFNPEAELIIATTNLQDPKVVEAKEAVSLVKLSDNDELLAIDPTVISRAYEACLTVAAGIKQLEKKIKTWSEVNGPFVVGDAKYGWRSDAVKILDEPLALKMILESDMEIPDILKCVNISKSSVEKIPKRKWGELREAIINSAISDGESKSKFGIMED